MEIRDDEEYKVKECGKITEVQKSSNIGRRKKKGSIRKISNEQYVVLSTGEVKEFKQKVIKNEDNARSMRRALGKCRDIINSNLVDDNKAISLTLTYAENENNVKQVGKDFTAFIRRFRNKIGECEYIYVVELQKRGSWHIHSILIFDKKAPYISCEDIEIMWGKGIIDIQNAKNAIALGLYLTSDVKKDESGNTKVKGAPIEKYEKGMRIFRCSCGLKKPTVKYKNGKEIKNDISDKELIHETNYEYTAPNGFHAVVQKNTYKNNIC